ncbi:MAG: hypothetical protein U0704_02350 [Candidatus Eisenbacteria bacterium]
MPARTPFRPLAAFLLAASCMFAAGCGAVGQQANSVGDVDGEHLLVFATDRTGGGDVALYDLDRAGYRGLPNLNSALLETEPALSEDGLLLAFSSNRPGGAGGEDVYVYGRGSMGVLDVPNLNTAANESWPRFAADNIRLAFVRDSVGWRRIKLYDPRGDSLVSLRNMTTIGAFHDDQPAPDLHADRIAFVSGRSGRDEVLVWNRTSGLAAPAGLAGDALDAEPSLTSNGRWLAFASTRSGGAGGWDVYLYDLTNSAFVRLPRLNTAGDERHPSVNAEGTRLFFQQRATNTDDWDLHGYTIADSTVRNWPNLSDSTANDVSPTVRWR